MRLKFALFDYVCNRAGVILESGICMPRKTVPISGQHPYHITARCINREWFRLGLPTVWSIMCDYLYLCHQLYGVQIHSFVLMPNHFHLIVTSPNKNLSEFLLYFMRETSREITRLSGRINQTYGSRNHKCLINSYRYFMNCYKYVYQNPLRAELSKTVESYPFSTLNKILGLDSLVIPICDDSILFNPTPNQEVLDWLNERRDEHLEEEMRQSLKRSIMEYRTSRKTNKLSVLAMEVF